MKRREVVEVLVGGEEKYLRIMFKSRRRRKRRQREKEGNVKGERRNSNRSSNSRQW